MNCPVGQDLNSLEGACFCHPVIRSLHQAPGIWVDAHNELVISTLLEMSSDIFAMRYLCREYISSPVKKNSFRKLWV